MVKRFLALMIALMLLAPAAVAEDALLDRACEMARLLDEMAGSDEYISLMSGMEELQAQARAWSGGHDRPSAAYAFAVDQEGLVRLMGESADEICGNFSDALKRQLCKQLVSGIPSMLNGRYGATTLAAASVCRVSTAFSCDTLTEDSLYLLVYQDAAPVMVCFTLEDNGVVSANATFLAGDEATAITDEEELSALLSMLPGIKVEVLPLP